MKGTGAIFPPTTSSYDQVSGRRRAEDAGRRPLNSPLGVLIRLALAFVVAALSGTVQVTAGEEQSSELEFCTYNLDLTFGQTFNIRDFVRFKDGNLAGQPVDWSEAFFTYTEAGADDPVSEPPDWNLGSFNAGTPVTVGPEDAEPGTGNHGDGRYRVYLVRNGLVSFDDHMTIRISEDPDNDFGDALCPGVIGDLVWDDSGPSPDGIQGPNEPGIPAVDVLLFSDLGLLGVMDPADELVTQDTTDASGHYFFPNLPAGDYIVLVAGASLSGFVPTLQQQGADRAVDSDGNSANFATVSLSEGDIDLTIDFGFFADEGGEEPPEPPAM